MLQTYKKHVERKRNGKYCSRVNICQCTSVVYLKSHKLEDTFRTSMLLQIENDIKRISGPPPEGT